MARRIFKSLKTRGFTLVELLIVVAIIGVLATIGIPTFRKMVQKAKKSEAKVALGALFTAEAAFYSEYGAYGSHITKVGYELDGTRLLYTVGFTTNACANQPAVFPTKANPIGVQINNAYPGYYVNDLQQTINGVVYNPAGLQTMQGRQLAGAMTCYQPPAPAPIGGIQDPGNLYVASATGCIAPGCLPNSGLGTTAGGTAAVPVQDVWTVDNTRLLMNKGDGVSQ